MCFLHAMAQTCKHVEENKRLSLKKKDNTGTCTNRNVITIDGTSPNKHGVGPGINKEGAHPNSSAWRDSGKTKSVGTQNFEAPNQISKSIQASLVSKALSETKGYKKLPGSVTKDNRMAKTAYKPLPKTCQKCFLLCLKLPLQLNYADLTSEYSLCKSLVAEKMAKKEIANKLYNQTPGSDIKAFSEFSKNKVKLDNLAKTNDEVIKDTEANDTGTKMHFAKRESCSAAIVSSADDCDFEMDDFDFEMDNFLLDIPNRYTEKCSKINIEEDTRSDSYETDKEALEHRAYCNSKKNSNAIFAKKSHKQGKLHSEPNTESSGCKLSSVDIAYKNSSAGLSNVLATNKKCQQMPTGRFGTSKSRNAENALNMSELSSTCNEKNLNITCNRVNIQNSPICDGRLTYNHVENKFDNKVSNNKQIVNLKRKPDVIEIDDTEEMTSCNSPHQNLTSGSTMNNKYRKMSALSLPSTGTLPFSNSKISNTTTSSRINSANEKSKDRTHKKSASGFFNSSSKSISGSKMVSPAKCPVCQWRFPDGWKEFKRNQHASKCLSDSVVLDDEDDDLFSEIDLNF